MIGPPVDSHSQNRPILLGFPIGVVWELQLPWLGVPINSTEKKALQ